MNRDSMRVGQKLVWSPKALLVAWGEWHQYGQARSITAGRGIGEVSSVDEHCLAYEYVRGLYLPPRDIEKYGCAFDRAEPLLLHVYARLQPIESFRVSPKPRQSRYGALIDLGWADLWDRRPDWRVAELVMLTWAEAFELRCKERPFSAGGEDLG